MGPNKCHNLLVQFALGHCLLNRSTLRGQMVEDGELSGFEACSPNVLEQSLGESGQMMFHYYLSEANMDPKVFL